MRNKRKTKVVAVPIIQEQQQKERISISKELGRYLLDISKLVIGGAVITTALQLNSDKSLVIIIAFCIAITFSVFGFIVLIFKNK